MSLKREFAELASAEGSNMSELCRRFGVSRPTGYKWLRRWREAGKCGLEERSRRPAQHPLQTSGEMESAILGVRDENPVWGGRKIRRRLQNLGMEGVPSASTVTAVLRRHGRLTSGQRAPRGPMVRFERDAPNDLWQMDYKGDFQLSRGGRCYPLTACDDHSRFNLVLAACSNQRTATVRDYLSQAFQRYGLPRQILCDNAPPWGVPDRSSRYTALGVWLLELGVETIHGRPYHPQTQGKEERFHRTLAAEVISKRTEWLDLGHCTQAFAHWREKYNHERPHYSLDDEVPASRYRVSERTMPECVAPAESHYLAEDELRRVKSKGEITFRNHFFYIGQAFVGKTVALRRCGAQKWDVFFCWRRLGSVDFSALTKEKHRYEPLGR